MALGYNWMTTQTEQNIVAISTPFRENEKFYNAGIEYCRSLTGLLPERWWLYHDIGGLAECLGEEELAKEALARYRRGRTTLRRP